MLAGRKHAIMTMSMKAADSARMVCVDDFEREAEKVLDSSLFGYVRTGADEEVTLKDNVTAFKR